MLRIRTLYNLGLSFSLRNLDFDYGFNGETTYTEYGYVVGYSNIETLNGQSFYSLNGLGEYSTKAATINFVTSEPNQQVTFTIQSNSSENDFMCIGNLDSDSIDVAAAKVCGVNVSKTYTYTIATPGAHYVKAFYKKGEAISNSSSDKGYVRMIPFTNTRDITNSDNEIVIINAKKSWEITSKPSWISVNKSSGDTGVTEVIVTAQVNTSSNSRTGSILFVDEKNKEYEIEITQTNHPSVVEISKDALFETSDSNSDKFTVNISGNTSWAISGYSGDKNDYFTISPTSGTNGTEVTVNWNENTNKTTKRTTDIYIKGNLGGSDKIKLYQERNLCSCDCNVVCTCDSDTWCTSDYTNKCTCDCDMDGCNSQTFCTCNTKVTACTNCTSDTCACNTKGACTCDGKTTGVCTPHCNPYVACSSNCTCNCNGNTSCGPNCSSESYCRQKTVYTNSSKNQIRICPTDGASYGCSCNCNVNQVCNSYVSCTCNSKKTGGCNVNVTSSTKCNCDCDTNCTCNAKTTCSCNTKTTSCTNCSSDTCACYCYSDGCNGYSTCSCNTKTTACTNCSSDTCKCNCNSDGCVGKGTCSCNTKTTACTNCTSDTCKCNCDSDACHAHTTCSCNTKVIYCNPDCPSNTCKCNCDYDCVCDSKDNCTTDGCGGHCKVYTICACDVFTYVN